MALPTCLRLHLVMHATASACNGSSLGMLLYWMMSRLCQNHWCFLTPHRTGGDYRKKVAKIFFLVKQQLVRLFLPLPSHLTFPRTPKFAWDIAHESPLFCRNQSHVLSYIVCMNSFFTSHHTLTYAHKSCRCSIFICVHAHSYFVSIACLLIKLSAYFCVSSGLRSVDAMAHKFFWCMLDDVHSLICVVP